MNYEKPWISPRQTPNVIPRRWATRCGSPCHPPRCPSCARYLAKFGTLTGGKADEDADFIWISQDFMGFHSSFSLWFHGEFMGMSNDFIGDFSWNIEQWDLAVRVGFHGILWGERSGILPVFKWPILNEDGKINQKRGNPTFRQSHCLWCKSIKKEIYKLKVMFVTWHECVSIHI